MRRLFFLGDIKSKLLYLVIKCSIFHMIVAAN